MDRMDKLFHPRQLATLEALSDDVKKTRPIIIDDCRSAGMSTLNSETYADAVQIFLALSIDRAADFNNSLCRWSASNQKS